MNMLKCRPCHEGRHSDGSGPRCQCCETHAIVMQRNRPWVKNPDAHAVRYPACQPCFQGQHPTITQQVQGCSCCAMHFYDKPCPGCGRLLYLDRGGGPYHPTIFCSECGHTEFGCDLWSCSACEYEAEDAYLRSLELDSRF